jgi:hypothetical protein
MLLYYVMLCTIISFMLHYFYDRLCGLVVSVADYQHRGPGFDSRALVRIFWGSWVWNGVHSASWSDKLSSYLNKEVTVRFGKLKMQLCADHMSTQYRLVQSGKTASGGCSAGQGSSEPVAPRKKNLKMHRFKQAWTQIYCYILGFPGNATMKTNASTQQCNGGVTVENCDREESSSELRREWASTCGRRVVISSCIIKPVEVVRVLEF